MTKRIRSFGNTQLPLARCCATSRRSRVSLPPEYSAHFDRPLLAAAYRVGVRSSVLHTPQCWPVILLPVTWQLFRLVLYSTWLHLLGELFWVNDSYHRLVELILLFVGNHRSIKCFLSPPSDI